MIDLSFLKKAASLAYISLHDEEIEPLRKAISDILAFVEELKGVDTRGVIPMVTPAAPCVLSFEEKAALDDAVQVDTCAKDVLGNAPSQDNDYFLIPRFIN